MIHSANTILPTFLFPVCQDLHYQRTECLGSCGSRERVKKKGLFRVHARDLAGGSAKAFLKRDNQPAIEKRDGSISARGRVIGRKDQPGKWRELESVLVLELSRYAVATDNRLEKGAVLQALAREIGADVGQFFDIGPATANRSFSIFCRLR